LGTWKTYLSRLLLGCNGGVRGMGELNIGYGGSKGDFFSLGYAFDGIHRYRL